MIIDQNTIEELIACPKILIKEPGEWKKDRGHFRIDFELQSEDERYYFTAFGRYNEDFNENFSFGLVYYPKNETGSYEIVRCNGPHGEHRQYPHHIHYHIHRASEEAVEKGLRADSSIEITTGYTNYEEAFMYFAQYINMNPKDIQALFPPKQTSLFD